MNTQQDFDNAAEQWLRTHRYTADTQVLERIALRVRENLEQLGGYVSSSSFERAYLELVSEKAIQPFRGTVTEHAAAEVTAIPQDAVDFIEQASAVEQRKPAMPVIQRSDGTMTPIRRTDVHPSSISMSNLIENFRLPWLLSITGQAESFERVSML